jgi:hypothetical protein
MPAITRRSYAQLPLLAHGLGNRTSVGFQSEEHMNVAGNANSLDILLERLSLRSRISFEFDLVASLNRHRLQVLHPIDVNLDIASKSSRTTARIMAHTIHLRHGDRFNPVPGLVIQPVIDQLGHRLLPATAVAFVRRATMKTK